MASANSSKGTRPSKPYPGFPLGWHSAGYWCKRIRGKLHYFGPRWGGWQQALEEYQRVRDDLHAGRKPRTNAEGMTLRLLCNTFLTDRKHRVQTNELNAFGFSAYKRCCQRIVSTLDGERLAEDIGPDDFLNLRAAYPADWSPQTVANEVQRTKALMNYAWQAGLIEKPVRYGPTFVRPSKRVMRLHRQSRGEKMFSPDNLSDLLDIARVQLRAMILLGVNCGYGNDDCGRLPIDALDLDGGWATFPRPKTGITRRCWLWPETVSAIRAALDRRLEPRAKKYAGLVFITRHRQSWARDSGNSPALSVEFRRLLDKLELHRPGLGFYALRHTFRTIADETRDQPAIDHIMGHHRDDMASVYRERIGDDRLRAVAMHVHAWLFGEGV